MATIAICGMDGSGKTTLAKHLKHHFSKNNKKSIIYSPHRYVLFDVFLRQKRKYETKKGIKKQHRNKKFIFKFWPLFASLDYLFHIKKIKSLEKKCDVLILDRYFYDLATGFMEYNYGFKWTIKLYLGFIKKPKKTMILIAEPKKAKSKEIGDRHTMGFFIRQKKRYESIAKSKNIPIFTNNYSKKFINKMIKYATYQKK